MATLRLLEVVRDQSPSVKFIMRRLRKFSGTRLNRRKQKKRDATTSPYGCAKAFATQLARVYRQSYGMFVCNGILYNHESPRRGENFVTRKIAHAAARISRGLDVDLVLGNLEGKRIGAGAGLRRCYVADCCNMGSLTITSLPPAKRIRCAISSKPHLKWSIYRGKNM